MKRPFFWIATPVLAAAATFIVSCASSPPPKPAPPDDPLLGSLTDWLKLDRAQQEKTRHLLKELDQRNAAIHEKWAKGAKVHPEELLVSRGLFERDFLAILTEDQKRIFAEANLKLQMKGGRSFGPGP